MTTRKFKTNYGEIHEVTYDGNAWRCDGQPAMGFLSAEHAMAYDLAASAEASDDGFDPESVDLDDMSDYGEWID